MPNDKGASTKPRGKDGKGKDGKGKFKKTESKSPAPLNLSGKYKFTRPVVETQHIYLQRNMVGHTQTMRKTVLKIRDRTANLSVFAGNYIDKNDVDADGKGKEKSFVPSAFREKFKRKHLTIV